MTTSVLLGLPGPVKVIIIIIILLFNYFYLLLLLLFVFNARYFYCIMFKHTRISLKREATLR